MSTNRYRLERYKGMSTRYFCPNCQHLDRTFTRYIDTLTGEHIQPGVGRCNREDKCGYHFSPKQYFEKHGTPLPICSPLALKSPPDLPVNSTSFIPKNLFRASLSEYESNAFVNYLRRRFGDEITTRLIEDYRIGSSMHWEGATIFWQIDMSHRVRTGKIMLYNENTGKRIKDPYVHINWPHKVFKLPNFVVNQCFFGEHLLRDNPGHVAIVESEKTAIIARAYLPEIIWLATGGLSNLNAQKCAVLKGRDVFLFPDLNGYEKWAKIARELSQIANFRVMDTLERDATVEERNEGLDLADYLLGYDIKTFDKLCPRGTALIQDSGESNE